MMLTPLQIDALKSILSQTEVGDKNPLLLEIWDAWVLTLDLSVQARANHYEMIRRQIIKSGSPLSSESDWFTTNFSLSPITYNNRLSYLKKMTDWTISQGLVSVNPWLKVKPRKKVREVIKPFTKDEAKLIISEFERSYPAWVPFLKFLFLTGCRMSEVIGLQWKHIDFTRNEICICESLPRRIDEGFYQRVRKDTKTGSVRFLKINTAIAQVLDEVKPTCLSSTELVFKNPTGTNFVDSGNFRKRWIKVLESAGVAYRRPHIIRHSFASHAIEQGMSLTAVAYLLGHADTRMVAQTYGHLINRPNLPDIL